MKKGLMILCILVGLAFAGLAWAEGPHDMQCMDCHTTHYAKGSYAIGVQPKIELNPARTKSAANVEAIDALCLGCHNEDSGIKPVKIHQTHPTSVKPTYAKVPEKLLWDGKMTCVSCHNPHPSNTNYMYLIVSTSKGKDMGVFCAQCHPEQSHPDTVKKAEAAPLKIDLAQPPIVRVTEETAHKSAPAAPPAGDKKQGTVLTPPKKN